MRRKRFVAVLLATVLLVGCGHESREELTDIEQFRCQDSIQTVFGVLGETEIKTSSLEGEKCEYEDLNLYGYAGTVTFKLRDNKDTVSSFYASLELNKKEFEDVLAQLEDKYGKCEKSEYTNQIAYVWEIAEDKAKEIGYNRISLSDYGDKKAIVNFSDEWSMYEDETYYKYLEEEKEEIKIIHSKDFVVDGKDLKLSITEESGEVKINAIGDAETEEKASLMLAIFISQFDELNLDGYSILINCGELYVTLLTTDSGYIVAGTNRDGATVVSMPDWTASELTMTEDEANAYSNEILSAMKEFGQSYLNE